MAELTMIGYWRGGGQPDLPDPADLVDAQWDVEERALVACYLVGGALAVQWRGYSWCRICDLEENGSADLTDGTYVWPQGLAHYVREHAVRLPPSVVEHVRAQTERREADVLAAYARGAEAWRAMTRGESYPS